MGIAEFQQLIRDRYYPTDSARGPEATFLWFAGEFGELAEAIARRQRGEENQAQLADEFAQAMDVLTQRLILLGEEDVGAGDRL